MMTSVRGCSEGKFQEIVKKFERRPPTTSNSRGIKQSPNNSHNNSQKKKRSPSPSPQNQSAEEKVTLAGLKVEEEEDKKSSTDEVVEEDEDEIAIYAMANHSVSKHIKLLFLTSCTSICSQKL